MRVRADNCSRQDFLMFLKARLPQRPAAGFVLSGSAPFIFAPYRRIRCKLEMFYQCREFGSIGADKLDETNQGECL
jgi:hypothetical protein